MTKKIAWPQFLFLAGYHLFLAIALPLYFLSHTPSLGLIWAMLALVFITGISVTVLYHRGLSHSCYKIHPAVEAILLFFATMATQGSALRWVHDHRLHHSHVDTEKDPYSVKKGFWYAHILWMFFKSPPIDRKIVSDLCRKKLLVFQHDYYKYCMVITNVVAFLAVGWMFSDYLGAFLFAWWGRSFLSHHTTWCINSLAHYWGSRNYSQEHSAVDNYLISLITYGEGYHNYHHTFAQDYRNGVRWYHFDPSKWLVWSLHRLGLAYDLKTVNDSRIAKQLLLKDKEELVSKLKDSQYVEKINEIADAISTKLAKIQSCLDSKQLRDLKKSVKEDWRAWKQILKTIQKDSLLT